MTYETRYNKITHGGGGGEFLPKKTKTKKKRIIIIARLFFPPGFSSLPGIFFFPRNPKR